MIKFLFFLCKEIAINTILFCFSMLFFFWAITGFGLIYIGWAITENQTNNFLFWIILLFDVFYFGSYILGYIAEQYKGFFDK